MGDPKKSRKQYKSLRRPWEKDRIKNEKIIKINYGLRRNKEIRKAESILRVMRRRARKLTASQDSEETKILLNKANNLGFISKNASLDEILGLNVETLLERRLQSQVVKNKMANTMPQARQFIIHGHIVIDGQKIESPSYLVSKQEEEKIAWKDKSKLKNFKIIVKKVKEKGEKVSGKK